MLHLGHHVLSNECHGEYSSLKKENKNKNDVIKEITSEMFAFNWQSNIKTCLGKQIVNDK